MKNITIGEMTRIAGGTKCIAVGQTSSYPYYNDMGEKNVQSMRQCSDFCCDDKYADFCLYDEPSITYWVNGGKPKSHVIQCYRK